MSVSHYPRGIALPANAGGNPFGNTWFVDATNGSDAYPGDTADRAVLTIAKAIELGVAGDNIILSPGTHSVDVSASALIPLADMQFIAAIPPMGGKPSTIITHDADDGVAIVAIDVDGVGFHGIEFLMVAGGTTAIQLINASQTTAVTGLVFRDCWFNQNSVDASGVLSLALNDATNATTGLVIKNCRFIGADATTNVAYHISVGVTGIPDALIEDNVFVMQSIDGDCSAMIFADPTATTGSYAMTIRNNDFIGPVDGGGDAVALVFNASMTEDEIVPMIRTNYFSNCTVPITIDKVNNGMIQNYVGDNATGGTLVDPGT